MNRHESIHEPLSPEWEQSLDDASAGFGTDRREFVQVLGAGLLISWAGHPTLAQQRRGRRGGRRRTPTTIAQRLHIGTDGTVTVLTGKVEVGQGARTSIAQAAAEELKLPLSQIQMVMADTSITPNDGGTSGSRTTPSTIPAVRNAAATAREVLIDLAAERWNADRTTLTVGEGKVIDSANNRSISYGELAGTEALGEAFKGNVGDDVAVTPVDEWRILGTSVRRMGGEDIVTGRHEFPSDIVRPGMLYGKVLRPISFGATLTDVDLAPARAMEGVVVVRDGDFVGCAAESSHRAEQAIQAIAKTAKWDRPPHPSSKNLSEHLKANVSSGGRARTNTTGSIETGLAEAKTTLRADYDIAYIAHAPMEPRAAVAEWNGDKVTIWTGTQNPTRVRSDVTRVLGISDDQARVIVPDTGGGFGGKHSGETATEAARIAKAAGKPVKVNWTREEEFTWAYFRPGGLIEIEAGLDEDGKVVAWDFANYNSGASAIATPYAVPHIRTRSLSCDSPLREGSYRGLASAANTFARESFMDELAAAAKSDPLEFRLRQLQNDRMRAVLTSAAERFGWKDRVKTSANSRGVGLSCGTEKGSYVAACVEVEVDRQSGKINVLKICQAFECGAILNPANLKLQVEGSIIMGLGGALTEKIEFENGQILNPKFSSYSVPRFKDVPEMEIVLVNRPDLSPIGAGETPIIAVAPAIGNAVFQAIGVRLRALPLTLEA